MKTKTLYICDICDQQYDNEQDALKCESTPLKDDKGVEIGDVVLITGGEGKGHHAKVSRLIALKPTWYNERYHHSIALTAEVIDSWGSRLLTFNDYEVLK